jgi:hypothetical protein
MPLRPFTASDAPFLDAFPDQPWGGDRPGLCTGLIDHKRRGARIDEKMPIYYGLRPVTTEQARHLDSESQSNPRDPKGRDKVGSKK